jgi:hypothetical protein
MERPDWDAELAWTTLHPRLDALIADGVASAAPLLSAGRALQARYWALCAGQWSRTQFGHVECNEMHQDDLQGHVRRLGVCKLLLAADRFRRRTGSWPTSASDLEGTIDPADAECALDGRRFELRVDSVGLTMWYPTRAGETASNSTPSVTLKR